MPLLTSRTADRSQSGRVRRLKGKAIAASSASSISQFKQPSVRLALKQGQADIVTYDHYAIPLTIDAGCCNSCLPVCDMTEDIYYLIWPITDIAGAEDFANGFITDTVTFPQPPEGYTNDYFVFTFSLRGCNITSSTATVYIGDTVVPITQHDLGYYPATNPSESDIGFVVIYPPNSLPTGEDFLSTVTGVTVTSSNACSSVTDDVILGCFLPGTPVALAGGVTKPIEDVKVGDLVIGAFGEVNPVTALHRPLLGGGKVCRINDEHTTTTHHPHIGADRGFFTPNPAALNNFTYGQKHTVILGDGTKEKRVMTGVRRDRILKLEEGTVLQTLTGPKTVTKVEPVAMSPFTQVYHLVVGGSHTYTVDGYAVVGWAREDDFDYDSWTPKVDG